jgi:hypothetical protein
MLPISRCLSATGIRFLGVLFPHGIPLSSQSAYHRHPKSAADRNGVSTFPTRETRPGRVPS